MKRKIEFILILFVLAFLSCSEDNAINERIDRIKKTGDKSPLLALTMLDSLNTAVRSMAEGTAMKYDLLKLRLQDKAYITANSDLVIKKLLKYYEEKGSIAEKQEVYYYAGSVYRDLQDTPRAISYFLKSSEIATIYATSDSTMQKNSYSNLFYLFFHVQDYQNAYKYAYEEYVQSQKIGKLDIISLTHLGDAFRSLDSLEQAKQLFVMALDTVTTTPTLRTDIETICNLLLELSFLKDSLNAQRCYTLLINRKSKYEKNQRQNYFDENNGINYALAHYYDMIGDKDSTIYYNRLILQDGTDLFRMYDSSKALFHIYNKRGDNTEAAKYADLYIQISDSIDLGKRQELAATVNNEFQYHLDKNEERRIMEENDRFRFLLAISFMTCVITLFTASLVIIYRRNKHLQKMLTMSEEQNRLINEKENLLQNIDKQENELAEVKMQLKSQDTELGHLKFQNQTFLNLLHQSELEEKAEDVIYTIRQSAEGKKNMQSTDWKQLYKAVDELYPTFQNLLLEKLGNFTEQQMQVCYLMRIGLSKPQIQNMTNLSRVTIWRWTKKYEWILGLV